MTKLMWVYLFIGANCIAAVAHGAVPVIGDVPLSRNRHVVMGVPTGGQPSDVIISRAQYALEWNDSRRGPSWVGWELTKKQLGDISRSNVFRIDHDLQEYLQEKSRDAVKPAEYQGSCLDRGHQVPSADRTALLTDNQVTFFMSNIVPQAAYMNRVTWASLEKFLRELVVEQDKELNIYTTTIYDNKGSIGTNDDIEVPSSNAKIVVIKPAGKKDVPLSQMRLLVVTIPNVTSKNTDPVYDHEQACYDSQHTARLDDANATPYWRKHISDLRTVETESELGFSFLSKIPKLTKAELDDMLATQYNNIQPYLNLMQKMGEALRPY